MWFTNLLNTRRLINLLCRRRRLLFFTLIIIGFFFINAVLIVHYLDVQSRLREVLKEDNGLLVLSRPSETILLAPLAFEDFQRLYNCTLSRDVLSTFAFERMTTEQCRQKITEFLCSLDTYVGWPVPEINNTCHLQFDHLSYRQPVGCYKDSAKNHFLKGFKYSFPETNNPDNCANTCLRAGYAFAGVGYKTDCFCAHSMREDHSDYAINESLCRTDVCPLTNNFSFCGGNGAISVYKTGVIAIKKRVPKFVYPPHLAGDDGNVILFNVKDYGVFHRPKILFLLQLNGRNSRQIRRLIKLIYRPEHLYYVHVDARQEFMFKEMLDVELRLRSLGEKNFYVAKGEDRYVTIWGGASLLEMFLNVVRSTLEVGRLVDDWSDWDYVLNLSETDMPLLSINELEYNLFSNPEMSFLSSHGYDTASFIQKQGFNFYFMECERRMWRIGARRNYPERLRLDGGSDWVVVHRSLAEFAISNRPLAIQLRHLFSTILLPLESFFHTLALNSEFCDRVLYRNLRLTNWRRKQGCRCAWLKKVVDWCGCSPLAIRHYEQKFSVERCISRVFFFGRKFDSLIDAETVTMAERQVLRHMPDAFLAEREKAGSFHATWLNFYRFDVDGNASASHRNFLYHIWAKSLYQGWFKSHKNLHESSDGCGEFVSLNEILGFKRNSDSSTGVELIVNLNLTCDRRAELLVGHVARGIRMEDGDEVVVDNGGRQYALQSMEYGTGLDLKEEVFRDFTAIADTSGSVTILWRWFEKVPDHFSNGSLLPATNRTSPRMKLELYNSGGQMVHVFNVKPYDSTNFVQFVDVSIGTMNGSAGIWTAVLRNYRYRKMATIQFPVFPNVYEWNSDRNGVRGSVDALIDNFYRVFDFCWYSLTERSSGPTDAFHKCTDSAWSSRFPDPKSEIHYGFDETLRFLF